MEKQEVVQTLSSVFLSFCGGSFVILMILLRKPIGAVLTKIADFVEKLFEIINLIFNSGIYCLGIAFVFLLGVSVLTVSSVIQMEGDLPWGVILTFLLIVGIFGFGQLRK